LQQQQGECGESGACVGSLVFIGYVDLTPRPVIARSAATKQSRSACARTNLTEIASSLHSSQ
jgi:hypothetical protein